MAGRAQGAAAFRRWVVAKLATSVQKWPAGSEEELAEYYGVSVAAYREARELQGDQRAFGEYQKFDGGIETRRVSVIMPGPIMAAMEELGRIMDVPRPTLLRSVVQHVLTLPELPAHDNYRSGHGWTLQGVCYKLERRAAESGKKKHRSEVMTYITLGAHEALQLRANLNKTVPTALVRGGLIDLLEGRVPRIPITPSPRYMSDSCSSYVFKWKESHHADPE